jgi:hypothetical protein
MVVILMVFMVVVAVVVVADGGVVAYSGRGGGYGDGLSLTFQVRDKAHSVIQ